jgi:hypothetical protein
MLPKTLEKSFPVPKGTIPMGNFSMAHLYLTISLITHMTVPSPPHTTILIIEFSDFIIKNLLKKKLKCEV